jgi:transposase
MHFQFRHPPPSITEYKLIGGMMELVALYKRVIGLDVHQGQITACALIEEDDGTTRIEQRQFGTFKKDRRALADWVGRLQ